MKMTADTLLKAMSYADEALVEQTAPKHSGETAGQKPRRFIIRRFTEIAAVCAALVFCVAAVFGINRLKDDVALSPEAQAKAVLRDFLAACKKGDDERILETSLIEEMCELMPDSYGAPEECVGQFRIDNYQIDDCKNCDEYIQSQKQLCQDTIDFYTFKLTEKGKEELIPEIADSEQPYLDFLSKVEHAYTFHVTMTKDGEKGDGDMVVYCYDGEWLVQPLDYLVPRLSDEAQEYLKEYRSSHPESGTNHTASPAQTYE